MDSSDKTPTVSFLNTAENIPNPSITNPDQSAKQDRPVAEVKHVGTTNFFTNSQPRQSSGSKKVVLSIIFGFLLASLIFLGFLSYKSTQNPTQILDPLKNITIGGNSQLPVKTVANPITGVLYTEDEAKSWKTERPIGVMINNHVAARPQWGVSDADLVYEIVAEGGITRYLAFYLTTLPDKLGPVRSTREYYLVLVKELGDAMLMHIGWSPQALTAIETWPVRSLGRGGAQFDRDQARLAQGIAIEHTAYVGGPYLRELGNTLGWGGVGDFTVWKFKDDKPIAQPPAGQVDCPGTAGVCKNISIDFWDKGDYSANFKYKADTNTYLKFTGYDDSGNPIPAIDANTAKQLEIKNLIVQFVPEISIAGDDKGRLFYELVGSGEAIIFVDGGVTTSTWSKASRDARTMFYDTNGKEIEFDRGKFWISIVPDRNKDQVVY